MRKSYFRFLTYCTFVMTVFMSCQDGVDLVDFPIQEQKHLIGLQARGAIDTLVILPYPSIILEKKITPDAITLVIQTPKFYEYLLINKNNDKWRIDTSSSGRILSRIDKSETIGNNNLENTSNKFSFIDNGDVQYQASDGKKLNIPIRIIQKHPPSWLNVEKNDAPPLSPIRKSSLELRLEIDSLNLNRQERIKALASSLETHCLSHSSMILIRFKIKSNGKIIDFNPVKPISGMLIDDTLNDEITTCLRGIINFDEYNLGELKYYSSARGGPEIIPYLLSLKR